MKPVTCGRRPTQVSRDQSGDVEGRAAGDRGRSLALRYSRRYIGVGPTVAQLPFTARPGAPLVPAPLPALPIMYGELVLPGGLAGTGAAGSSSSADGPAKGLAVGAAAGRAWFTVAGPRPRVSP